MQGTQHKNISPNGKVKIANIIRQTKKHKSNSVATVPPLQNGQFPIGTFETATITGGFTGVAGGYCDVSGGSGL